MGHTPGLGAGEPAASRPRPGMAAPHRHVDLEPRSLARRRGTGARAAECARPPRQHLLALVASRPVRHELPRLSPAAGGRRLVPRRAGDGPRRRQPRDGLHESAAVVHRHAELDLRGCRALGGEGEGRPGPRRGLQRLRPAALRHHGCDHAAVARQVRRHRRHRAGQLRRRRDLHGSGGPVAGVLGLDAWTPRRWRELLDGRVPRARGADPGRGGAGAAGAAGGRRRGRAVAAGAGPHAHAPGEPGAVHRPRERLGANPVLSGGLSRVRRDLRQLLVARDAAV